MQTLKPLPSALAPWPRKAWSPSLGAATVLSPACRRRLPARRRPKFEFLTKPDGVAAFWPAAGIASGTVIALGSWARLPTVIGVAAATLAANLLGDRNLAGAVIFAACNAVEAILIGHLITQQFGARFSLDSVQKVLAFFGVVGIATVLSGIGGTAGFALFHSPEAPLLMIWANWVASDALGCILVAPLLIGLGGLLLDLPDRWEVAKATLTLAALVIVSATAFSAGGGWLVQHPASRVAFARAGGGPMPAGICRRRRPDSRFRRDLGGDLQHRRTGILPSPRSSLCGPRHAAGRFHLHLDPCGSVRRTATQRGCPQECQRAAATRP